MTYEVTLIDEVLEVAFKRVSARSRQRDHFSNRDTSVVFRDVQDLD